MKTKPIDLPIDKLRGNILNRLQQANSQIRIWRALRVEGHRHNEVRILHKYYFFTMAWPEAIITTFVIQLCSLFDRGQDCIVVRTYEAKLRQGGKDTAQSTDLIEQAETMINPLRDIRDNYYAHRLAEGAMSDLIEANGLTNDRLFEIYESVRDAVQGLLKLDEDEDAEFQENDPVPDLNRMITDLTAFDQQG